ERSGFLPGSETEEGLDRPLSFDCGQAFAKGGSAVKGRSPLWWKSGGFLAWIWVLGTLLVAGAAFPFLYEQWRQAEGLSAEYRAMSSYVDAHRESLESDLGDPPAPDALSQLADKVPPDRDVPRLLIQLRDAAEG